MKNSSHGEKADAGNLKSPNPKGFVGSNPTASTNFEIHPVPHWNGFNPKKRYVPKKELIAIKLSLKRIVKRIRKNRLGAVMLMVKLPGKEYTVAINSIKSQEIKTRQ